MPPMQVARLCSRSFQMFCNGATPSSLILSSHTNASYTIRPHPHSLLTLKHSFIFLPLQSVVSERSISSGEITGVGFKAGGGGGLRLGRLGEETGTRVHCLSGPMASAGVEGAVDSPPQLTVPKSAPAVVMIRNDEVVDCNFSAAEFLSSSQRGAYTTARTVNRHAVFEYESHVARLAQSVDLMMKDDASHGRESGNTVAAQLHPELVKADLLRPIVTSSVRKGIEEFERRFADESAELKVTILLSWGPQEYELSTHVSPLPPRPSPPVKVEIRGHPRENAAAKDSEWVRQRKELEKDKEVDVNEILLMSEDGDVLEGMTSNFFVIQNGAVVTAEEGVLLGTVRDVILSVCEHQGMRVERTAPNLRTWERWEGAFISSTSRLLLPVDRMSFPHPKSGEIVTREFNQPLTYRLASLVMGEVEANSTTIF